MRILLVSAFYPPFVIGGWEQLVEEIAEHLASRGHAIRVLTSTHGAGSPCSCQDGIDRVLELESDLVRYDPLRSFLGRKARLSRNLSRTREVLLRFEPDVVFVHGMWNLSRATPWLAEQLCPGRVVYYVANDWPYADSVHVAYWRQSAQRWNRRLFKRVLAPLVLRLLARESNAFPLQFERVLCVSHAVKSDLARYAGIPCERVRVIYNGVDTQQFVPWEEPHGASGDPQGLSLLYAGSLAVHKGVATAIKALALLQERNPLDGITLAVAGAGHPDYEAGLRELVERERLQDKVSFLGRVAREEMPALLRRFDVLVFPSMWEEPLARMVQEAMASGLIVVGTTTGGTKEILIEGETGLTFEPGDAARLALQIERVRSDPGLRSKLQQNARNRVLDHFDIRRMVDELEDDLSSVSIKQDRAAVTGTTRA